MKNKICIKQNLGSRERIKLHQAKIVISGSSTNIDYLLQMDKEASSKVKTIDTRGMACPYPSFESVKAMSSLNPNDSYIEILTDSEESALRSIPNVCEKRNWQFIVSEEGKDLWCIRISK